MSLRDAAYQQIRSRLMSGTLSPGTRLSHRALAKEIGVSFIPVREALSQLASEGLVEHRPQVGTFVTELNREELAEIFDLREALECHAVGTVAERRSDSDLAALEAQIAEQQAVCDEMLAAGQLSWSETQQERWRLSDASFHLVLLRAAGNCRLLKAVADLRVMVYTLRYQQRGRSVEGLQRIIADHRRILAALRSGDVTAARTFMAEHLRQGCREALESYDRGRLEGAAGSQPAGPP